MSELIRRPSACGWEWCGLQYGLPCSTLQNIVKVRLLTPDGRFVGSAAIVSLAEDIAVDVSRSTRFSPEVWLEYGGSWCLVAQQRRKVLVNAPCYCYIAYRYSSFSFANTGSFPTSCVT